MRFIGRSGVVSAIVACSAWGLIPGLAAAEKSDSSVSGITGTGAMGISGTGVQGISGTGVTGDFRNWCARYQRHWGDRHFRNWNAGY